MYVAVGLLFCDNVSSLSKIVLYLVRTVFVSFKLQYYLTKDNEQIPKYYYTGSRRLQILPTCLRTYCSSLNLDLFLKKISETPLCSCGSIENSQHYFFFHCSHHQTQRTALMNYISSFRHLRRHNKCHF